MSRWDLRGSKAQLVEWLCTIDCTISKYLLLWPPLKSSSLMGFPGKWFKATHTYKCCLYKFKRLCKYWASFWGAGSRNFLWDFISHSGRYAVLISYISVCYFLSTSSSQHEVTKEMELHSILCNIKEKITVSLIIIGGCRTTIVLNLVKLSWCGGISYLIKKNKQIICIPRDKGLVDWIQ